MRQTDLREGNGLNTTEKSFGKKLDNYWYHYKWHTIVGAILAVFILICTVQMCSKDRYDCHLLYAGPAVFGQQAHQEAVKTLSTLLPGDYDGNGRLTPDFTMVTYVSPDRAADYVANGYNYDPGINRQSKQTFSAELMNGQCLIYFMDLSLYEDTREYGYFVPLTDIFASSPACAYDEYALTYRDTPFAKQNPALSFPSDTVVCLRVKSSVSGKTVRDWEDVYAFHVEMFQNLVR